MKKSCCKSCEDCHFKTLPIICDDCCPKKASVECSSSSSSSSEEECCYQFEPLYRVLDLVSDISGRARHTNENAKNCWGILHADSNVYVCQEATGKVGVYDKHGEELHQITVQPAALTKQVVLGKPTGIVQSRGKQFLFGIGKKQHPAKFLIATLDGTIQAYNPRVNENNTVIVINTPGAKYTGLTICRHKIKDKCGVETSITLLYAADFGHNRIDVFDTEFNKLDGFHFRDHTLPSDSVVFNVFCHNDRDPRMRTSQDDGKIYVLYARKISANSCNGYAAVPDDIIRGPGNGLINVFRTNGKFIKRFTSHRFLNAPWGICEFSKDHAKAAGLNINEDLLMVGNNGDGTINLYRFNGQFLGRLRNCNCLDIIIDGLWGLSPTGKKDKKCGICNKFYFAAGPNEQRNGLIGKLVCCNKNLL